LVIWSRPAGVCVLRHDFSVFICIYLFLSPPNRAAAAGAGDGRSRPTSRRCLGLRLSSAYSWASVWPLSTCAASSAATDSGREENWGLTLPWRINDSNAPVDR
jgi:hypothetical protein